MERARRLGAAGALAIVVASGWRARRHDVGRIERSVFRTVNGAPDAVHGPVWVVMQYGSLGAVFATSEILRRVGHPRRAVVTLAAGTAMWGGAKAIKPLIGRGRPTDHLDDVQVRGEAQSGLGYPSGHAAVSVTLALVSLPNGRPGGLAGLLTAAGITGVARIYVGAHLPLDVAGGWALGALVGGAARTAMSRLDGR